MGKNQKKESSHLYEKVSHGSLEFPYELHITELKEGFSLYPHLHNEFELLVMEQGDGILVIDNREYILEEGDVVFIHSKEIHYGKKYQAENVKFYAIVFADRIFGSLYHDMIYNKYIVPVINNERRMPSRLAMKEEWMRRIHRIAYELYENHKTNDWEKELIVKIKLYELWSILCQHSEVIVDSRKEKHLPEIKEVIEYINDHYSSKIALTELAGLCHMSEGHFTRVFTKVMQNSPYQYLIDVRISKSCEMLRSTSRPIGEIGLACGFGDYSYYTKMFRKGMGCTPRGYRSGLLHDIKKLSS